MSLDQRRQRWWLALVGVLVLAIIAGGAVLGFKSLSRAKPVEIIVSSSDNDSPVEIYLDGVPNEGIYSFGEDVTLRTVIREAGGSDSVDQPLRVKITLLEADDDPYSQRTDDRVNINTASLAELQTLNGIGPVRAQAIVDYRDTNGPFRTVDELVDVPGIGPATLAAIIDLITVV